MGYAIVVDACIARAASNTADLTAQKCRETLDSIADNGHKLAMSKPLQDEWVKSKSKHGEPYLQYALMYALEWFVRMRTVRQVIWIELKDTGELRRQILETVDLQNRGQVEKDLHLAETALASDRRVLSLDDTIREHFREAGQIVEELCTILWLNPVRFSASDWLQNGAPDQQEYRLCHASP